MVNPARKLVASCPERQRLSARHPPDAPDGGPCVRDFFLGRIDLFSRRFVFPARKDRAVRVFDIVGQFAGLPVEPEIFFSKVSCW